MKKVLLLVFLSLAWLSVSAQALVPITWTAYGLTFEAPKGILVEEDTEETFLLNNSKFYITIQSLDSDGMTKSDLKSVLKDYANDDGVKDQSAVQEFELPQFFGTYLRGSCETDHCLYACLMTKTAGSGFYISIIYSKENENIAEKILKSFIRTNCTLVFSVGQALLAAKAGATYVSPFVGRLDDICEDGIALVAKIVEMYRYYGYTTQVLAASIRHTAHIMQCIEVGADVATCPLSAIKGLLNHPLTDSGLRKFLEDYKRVNG